MENKKTISEAWLIDVAINIDWEREMFIYPLFYGQRNRKKVTTKKNSRSFTNTFYAKQTRSSRYMVVTFGIISWDNHVILFVAFFS